MVFTTIRDADGRDVTVNAAHITHVMPLVQGCRVHLAGGQTIQAEAEASVLAAQLAKLSTR